MVFHFNSSCQTDSGLVLPTVSDKMYFLKPLKEEHVFGLPLTWRPVAFLRAGIGTALFNIFDGDMDSETE